MQQQLIKSITFFQHILYSNFRHLNAEGVEVLLTLSIGHLFGLYNPNQIADALEIPNFSYYQWKQMLLRIGCSVALDLVAAIASKSAATKSRYRITISVDDTVTSRFAKVLAYCYNWWSKNITTPCGVKICWQSR